MVIQRSFRKDNEIIGNTRHKQGSLFSFSIPEIKAPRLLLVGFSSLDEKKRPTFFASVYRYKIMFAKSGPLESPRYVTLLIKQFIMFFMNTS